MYGFGVKYLYYSYTAKTPFTQVNLLGAMLKLVRTLIGEGFKRTERRSYSSHGWRIYLVIASSKPSFCLLVGAFNC